MDDELVFDNKSQDQAAAVEAPALAEPAADIAGSEASQHDATQAVVSPGLKALRSSAVQQDEMPFAVVQGEAVTEIPRDLYIPPDALEVFLEAFEGPSRFTAISDQTAEYRYFRDQCCQYY